MHKNTIEGVRKSCKIASQVMLATSRAVFAGSTTLDVEAHAVVAMKAFGVRSAFFGYHGFPGEICVSINDEILHGIPSKRRIREGDLVKIDLGVICDGFYSDMAQTFLIDDGSDECREKRRLSDATLSSLTTGMWYARAGSTVQKIAEAISASLKSNGYLPVKGMSGHGVGVRLHEPPSIPNEVDGWDCSTVLSAGMTIAIEPMVGMGSPKARIGSNGWVVVMSDGMPSAHFEHTILITEGDPEILTA